MSNQINSAQSLSFIILQLQSSLALLEWETVFPDGEKDNSRSNSNQSHRWDFYNLSEGSPHWLPLLIVRGIPLLAVQTIEMVPSE